MGAWPARVSSSSCSSNNSMCNSSSMSASGRSRRRPSTSPRRLREPGSHLPRTGKSFSGTAERGSKKRQKQRGHHHRQEQSRFQSGVVVESKNCAERDNARRRRGGGEWDQNGNTERVLWKEGRKVDVKKDRGVSCAKEP